MRTVLRLSVLDQSPDLFPRGAERQSVRPVDMRAVQRIGEAGGAPAAALGVTEKGPDGVGVDPDGDARKALCVQVLEISVEVPQGQIRDPPSLPMEPAQELRDMPATVPQGAGREPAFLGHPSEEVFEKRGRRLWAGRWSPKTPDEEQPPSRDAKKVAAVGARAAVEASVRADRLEPSRCGLESCPIDIQAPVGVKVTRGGQENPRDLLERAVLKSPLAAVLQELLTLDRVRPDRVVHHVECFRE